jgi:hypothetical protein
MKCTSSAEDYKLLCHFEIVRQKLLEHPSPERLEQPLAFWTLPSDRRLPLALLSRRIGELLEHPFEELAATPGIGRKKMGTLIKLLLRASEDGDVQPPNGTTYYDQTAGPQSLSTDEASKPFDYTMVSELMWNRWCDTVRRFDLGHESLGRLAPSLQALPTVTWGVTLDTYLDLRISEIRGLKTHGEKRVRALLEVFHYVNEMLAGVVENDRLTIRLVPRLIARADAWIHHALASDDSLSAEDIAEGLATPLLEQVKIDTGLTVYQLACERVGLEGSPQSVRQQSRSLDVTRARIYQLLDECSKVMEVRWPEGRWLMANLLRKLEDDDPSAEFVAYFRRVCELFFPEKSDTLQPPVFV